jgi:hypothetical protein
MTLDLGAKHPLERDVSKERERNSRAGLDRDRVRNIRFALHREDDAVAELEVAVAQACPDSRRLHAELDLDLLRVCGRKERLLVELKKLLQVLSTSDRPTKIWVGGDLGRHLLGKKSKMDYGQQQED